MAYRERYKVTAPVARSTAYDFNCQLAKSHQRAMRADGGEDRNVMPHEILFEHRDNLRTNNARIHGCSSVNGMRLGPRCVEAVRACLTACGADDADAFSEMDQMHASTAGAQRLATYLSGPSADARKARAQASDVLTSFFTYMGVAVTPCAAGAAGGALQRQGFSATRGGLMTIVNTGTDVLRAGDKVRMVIDVVDVIKGRRDQCCFISGIPSSKIVARLAHVRPDTTTFADVAEGVTSRALALRLNEPSVLTPMLEYVGRLRFPWDWDQNDAVEPRAAFPASGIFVPLPLGLSNQHLDIARDAFNGGGYRYVEPEFKNSNFAERGHYSSNATVIADTSRAWLDETARIIVASDARIGGGTFEDFTLDLWMLLMIRVCEVYTLLHSIAPRLSTEAWDVIKSLIEVVDARHNEAEWVPVYVEVKMLMHAVTKSDGSAVEPPHNPSGFKSTAGRLNALHTFKAKKYDAYIAYGADYTAAETSSLRRHAWNQAETTRTEAATANLVNSMYARHLANGGALTDITDTANIATWRASATAALNDVKAELTLREARFGSITATEHKTYVGVSAPSSDAAVNHAVILKILITCAS